MEQSHKKIRYGRRDSEEPQFHSGVSAAGWCCYGITRSAPLDCALVLLCREPCTCFIEQARRAASAGAGWTFVCSQARCVLGVADAEPRLLTANGQSRISGVCQPLPRHRRCYHPSKLPLCRGCLRFFSVSQGAESHF